MASVDYTKGEWRCLCRPKDPTFDKSVNPAFVSYCEACKTYRPGRKLSAALPDFSRIVALCFDRAEAGSGSKANG